MEPDGWMIRHNRLYDSVHFGPFATKDEALAWHAAHESEGVNGFLVPLYRTVDWARRG